MASTKLKELVSLVWGCVYTFIHVCRGQRTILGIVLSFDKKRGWPAGELHGSTSLHVSVSHVALQVLPQSCYLFSPSFLTFERDTLCLKAIVEYAWYMVSA